MESPDMDISNVTVTYCWDPKNNKEIPTPIGPIAQCLEQKSVTPTKISLYTSSFFAKITLKTKYTKNDGEFVNEKPVLFFISSLIPYTHSCLQCSQFKFFSSGKRFFKCFLVTHILDSGF